jgi:uncharacterized protein YkwD
MLIKKMLKRMNGLNSAMKKLRYLFCLTLLLSLALPGCPDRKQSGGVKTQNLVSGTELEVFQQINEYRSSRSLKPLAIDERLVVQARVHSRDMAQGRTPFGHAGLQRRVRASGVAYSSAAENVAYNQGYAEPAAQAVAGWIKSAGHRRNIVGDFNLTGIGAVTNKTGTCYFTQLFIKKAGTAFSRFRR